MKRLAVAVILAVLVPSWVSSGLPPFTAPPIVAEVTAVIDGDTIRVVLTAVPESLANRLRVGAEATVRYIGVQAPELAEPDGHEAAELNRLLVEGRTIYLETDELLRNTDAGGSDDRLLAYVYLDPEGIFMVNLTLIATAIIGTQPYAGTMRYSALFARADGLMNTVAPRTCADCLATLNGATESRFDSVYDVGPAFKGPLANATFAIATCARETIIAAVARVKSESGASLKAGLAEVIVWTFCPWLFCESCCP